MIGSIVVFVVAELVLSINWCHILRLCRILYGRKCDICNGEARFRFGSERVCYHIYFGRK